MKKHLQIMALVILSAFCVANAVAAITYEYDSLNRLVSVTYDDGSAILFEYDAVGNRTLRVMNADVSYVYLSSHVEPAASGSVMRDPELTWYPVGQPVELTPVSEGVCHFNQWSGDVPAGQEHDRPLVLIPSEHTTITAHFGSDWGAMDADCNENGIPDGCEGFDCNDTGVLDECDIADGTSEDLDDNGIPDECDNRLGDLYCDGVVNAFDIDAFVLALCSANRDFDLYLAMYPGCDPLLADCNEDGSVNNFDIDPFVDLLTGG